MFSDGKKTFLAIMAFALAVTAPIFAEELTSKEAKSSVSRERAEAIALQRINGGHVVDSDFNDRWFRDNDYDFIVVDDANRYKVSVDAETGEVINVKQTPIYEDKLSTDERGRLGASASVTPERARSIAMERVPNAKIVEMGREMDSDHVVYNIELRGNNTKVDMKVDGATGKITSYEENRIERGEGMLRVQNRTFNRDVRAMDATTNRSMDPTMNRPADATTNRPMGATNVR